MGSKLLINGRELEINDTLKISKDRGFPSGLRLEDHFNDPPRSDQIVGEEFEFWNKDERYYHTPPTPVRLVEEINGLWVYWGDAQVTKRSVGNGRTNGVFKVTKLYSPFEMMLITGAQAPERKSFFDSLSVRDMQKYKDMHQMHDVIYGISQGIIPPSVLDDGH